MDTERMIRELRRTAKKHQNDVLHTFDTDISAMCTDVANRLEELNQSQKEIRNKAIDDFIHSYYEYCEKQYGRLADDELVDMQKVAQQLKGGGTDGE